jgi:hypothetical protein
MKTYSKTQFSEAVFHLHLSTDLTLAKIRNDFVSLPSRKRLREANVKNLKVGTLHNYLLKGGANLVG